MISVHSDHITVGLFYYVTVGGMAKTRMRKKMCKCASRLAEHSRKQKIVFISAVISSIVKRILFLAVFNQLMLFGDTEKNPELS